MTFPTSLFHLNATRRNKPKELVGESCLPARIKGRWILLFLIVFFGFWIWALLENEHENAEALSAERAPNVSPQTPLSPPASPRIIFLVVQTKVSHGWCRMLATSILSNVSVISIGFGRKYAHVKRPLWVLDFAEREGLRDSDVLVFFDGSDTVFSGSLPLRRAVADFVRRTAPSFGAFSAASVARGDAAAPLLFSAEANCYHPQLAGAAAWAAGKGKCLSAYKRAADAFGRRFPAPRGERRRRHFLNAGGFAARVWAMKMAIAAYGKFIAARRGWWCDQSAWGRLFLASMAEDQSVEDGMRIPLGVIGLDYRNAFFLSLNSMHIGRNIRLWNASSIAKAVREGAVHLPMFFDIVNNPNATPAIIHFNGLGRNARSTIHSILKHCSWNVESRRSPEALSHAKELVRRGMFVETRGVDGAVKKFYHSDVCRTDHIF